MTTLVAVVSRAVYEGSMPYALALAWEADGAAAWESCVNAEEMGILLDGCDEVAIARVVEACRTLVAHVDPEPAGCSFGSPQDTTRMHADLARAANTAMDASLHATQALAREQAKGPAYWDPTQWKRHLRDANVVVCDAIRAVVPCPTLATLTAAMSQP